MKTDYLILWIDDDFGELDTDRDEVRELLNNFGIRAHFEINELKPDDSEERSTQVHQRIEVILRNPELDMIFMDYNMDAIKGDKLIEKFRQAEVFLPVIFYSSQRNDMMRAAAETGIDGVYFSSRDRLGENAKKIIDSLLKKEHTIKSTRGMLMEGVSEIEASFDSLAIKIWNKLSDDQKKEILKYFREDVIKGKMDSSKKLYDNTPSNINEFGDLLKNHSDAPRYEAMSRWRLLKKMLEFLNHEKSKRDIFDDLNIKREKEEPLFTTRNNYGHKTRADLSAGHTVDKCVHVRRELRRHLENIEDIDKEIQR